MLGRLSSFLSTFLYIYIEKMPLSSPLTEFIIFRHIIIHPFKGKRDASVMILISFINYLYLESLFVINVW
jgi:hypothetical protein